jgi:hypothetical protein
VLPFVEPQRVSPPETTAAMTAAFERLCASIPKSVNGDDLRRHPKSGLGGAPPSNGEPLCQIDRRFAVR